MLLSHSAPIVVRFAEPIIARDREYVENDWHMLLVEC